ncbi:MAG: thiamine-phosphate kinase [Candidatus Anammoximicrobium sp.]|nr:thiamine-phosphate kinase [Candidatus Anammoximicrobium sp.]
MEAAFLSWLRSQVPGHPRLQLGIGDDAAILDLASNSRCVLTTDMLNDGVDFVWGQCDGRLVGRKSLAVNLSDLAAMAAQPLAALVSLTLPRRDALAVGQQLYQGLLPLADEFDVAIAGGDTGSWDGPLVIGITALGVATERGPLLRSGARPGDAIIVTGSFGGSLLGRHFRFTPRVREALLLNERYRLHAATDVSDGLALDLSHITQESGCGALVEAAAVPIADDAHRLAAADGGRTTPLEHALGDGEDFELILAAPPEEAARLLRDQPLDVPLTRIGTFTAERGLRIKTPDGRCEPLPPRGYEH